MNVSSVRSYARTHTHTHARTHVSAEYQVNREWKLAFNAQSTVTVIAGRIKLTEIILRKKKKEKKRKATVNIHIYIHILEGKCCCLQAIFKTTKILSTAIDGVQKQTNNKNQQQPTNK